MGNEALTLQQAADELGVHYMTAYRYVRLGVLEATKVGTSWQVARSEVDRLAAERRTGGTGEAGDGDGAGPSAAPAAPWAERLESRLRAGDEAGAWQVVEAAQASGLSPVAVYPELLAPAMRGIGDAWAAGELDIAVEHRASVIVMRLMGRLGPRLVRRGQDRGTVVIGTPPGDLHGLPAAMLADLVRGAGFAVADLGADVPSASFVHAATRAERLVAVAVSATTLDNETAVTAVVDALRAALPGIPVLLGGGAVADEDHARRLGADGWALDGPMAVALLDQLAATR